METLLTLEKLRVQLAERYNVCAADQFNCGQSAGLLFALNAIEQAVDGLEADYNRKLWDDLANLN